MMNASARRGGNAPAWVAQARAQAVCAPLRPRHPFFVAGQRVGSVDAQCFDAIVLQPLLDQRYALLKKEQTAQQHPPSWHLHCDPSKVTPALGALAQALRRIGHCGPWRDEQLAVCNMAGVRIGTVERAAMRALGLATQAVHLVGCAPGGRAMGSATCL